MQIVSASARDRSRDLFLTAARKVQLSVRSSAMVSMIVACCDEVCSCLSKLNSTLTVGKFVTQPNFEPSRVDHGDEELHNSLWSSSVVIWVPVGMLDLW